MLTDNRHLIRAGSIALTLLFTAPVFAADAPPAADARAKRAEAVEMSSPLALNVTPRFAFAGALVRAVVRVAPNAENRRLRITVDSDDYFQSSDVELDGEDAAVTHNVPMRALPAGRYSLVVVVFGSQGERARVRQTFRLMGEGDR